MERPLDLPDAAREPLTRVAIEPSQRRIEPAIDWCRHEVRRIVAWHLIGTAAFSFAVVVPLCWWQYGSVSLGVALGLLAATIAIAVRIGLVLVAGPLGFRYVQRYTTLPPEFQLARDQAVATAPPTSTLPPPDPIDLWDLDPNAPPPPAITSLPPPLEVLLAPDRAPIDPDRPGGAALDDDADEARAAGLIEIATELTEQGFGLAATVRADGRGGSIVDLYRDDDRIVVAVDHASGSLTLLTEMVGFRVLVTSSLLVPPTDELIVNVVEGGDVATLLRSHRRLVHEAFRSRTLTSEPVGLFKLAQQRELEAYRELGPFWGALLDLRCRPRGARLAAAPAAGDVLLFTGNRLFQHLS